MLNLPKLIAEKARAVRVAAKTQTTTEKTQQQKDLDTLFGKNPFDCKTEFAAQLVKILTGYEPVTNEEPKYSQFSIVMQAGTPFIILSGPYGLDNVETSNYRTAENGETVVDNETAEKFLVELENSDPAKYLSRIHRKLGDSHLKTIVSGL